MNDNYFFGIDSTLDDAGVETFVAFLLSDLDDDGILKPYGMAAKGETPYEAIGSLCDIFIAKSEKIASDLQQIYDLEYALDEKERANE